jgi:effector-binding domain-containing protein
MNDEFKIEETKEQPVLSVKTVTNVADLPAELGKAYGAIIAYLGGIGEQPENAAFSAYYNMDMENLEVEMGFPVAKPLPGKGEILASFIPAGKKAVCLYKGPYSEMAQTYESMMAWMSENAHKPTGVVYEFYYNSPMEVPESELLTKIMFLLE